MPLPSDFRRPAEDAYGDEDDDVLTYDELVDAADPDARSPLDLLIEAEEAERRRSESAGPRP